MRYLLDTHTWFWALEQPERIPKRSLSLLRNRKSLPYALSAISIWEMSKLVERGRIKLTIPLREWVDRATDPEMVEIVPLTPQIAVDSTMLPGGFHSDPADQIIVASARALNATLITADKRILKYGSVRSQWA